MILQTSIPYDTSTAPHLPGVAPLDMADWLCVDEAYAGQMAERARLLDTSRDTVLQCSPDALPAARELLSTVLAHLPEGFSQDEAQVTRPDGETLSIDWTDPLGTCGRLVQEDLCLMEKRAGEAEHVLTGAVLCFPASWSLEEKFMRPLLGIHRPVEVYDAALARRVQRLFDGVQPDRPLWRWNSLTYGDPTLHQPRREADRRPPVTRESLGPRYRRSERQCLVRLPQTRAVVFSIHTFVVPLEADG
jgi:hypothetical protein